AVARGASSSAGSGGSSAPSGSGGGGGARSVRAGRRADPDQDEATFAMDEQCAPVPSGRSGARPDRRAAASPARASGRGGFGGHVASPEGPDALASILERLEGFEAPAMAWETEILPARMPRYDPAWLDALCLTGRVAWMRLSTPGSGRA